MVTTLTSRVTSTPSWPAVMITAKVRMNTRVTRPSRTALASPDERAARVTAPAATPLARYTASRTTAHTASRGR